jgi:hypothetical protein
MKDIHCFVNHLDIRLRDFSDVRLVQIDNQYVLLVLFLLSFVYLYEPCDMPETVLTACVCNVVEIFCHFFVLVHLGNQQADERSLDSLCSLVN